MADELLIPLGTLVVNEEEMVELEVSEGTSNARLELEVSEGTSNASTYHGAYKVIPKVTEQELETKNKLMSDNVLVGEIPYSSVDNLAGGQTLTIGG